MKVSIIELQIKGLRCESKKIATKKVWNSTTQHIDNQLVQLDYLDQVELIQLIQNHFRRTNWVTSKFNRSFKRSKSRRLKVCRTLSYWIITVCVSDSRSNNWPLIKALNHKRIRLINLIQLNGPFENYFSGKLLTVFSKHCLRTALIAQSQQMRPSFVPSR